MTDQLSICINYAHALINRNKSALSFYINLQMNQVLACTNYQLESDITIGRLRCFSVKSLLHFLNQVLWYAEPFQSQWEQHLPAAHSLVLSYARMATIWLWKTIQREHGGLYRIVVQIGRNQIPNCVLMMQFISLLVKQYNKLAMTITEFVKCKSYSK